VRAASKYGLRSTYWYIATQCYRTLCVQEGELFWKSTHHHHSIHHPSSNQQGRIEERKLEEGRRKRHLQQVILEHFLTYLTLTIPFYISKVPTAHHPSKSKKNLEESRAEESRGEQSRAKQSKRAQAKRQRLILECWLFMNLSSPERS
jgi:hypothetical protein